MSKTLKFIISLGAPQLAGLIGSAFTFSAIPTWYATLIRPELAPPNWIFGPVWTTLYVLMGIAAFVVWNGPASRERGRAMTVFAVQLLLNALWSIAFFGFTSPAAGLVVIALLWLSIVLNIVVFGRLSRLAGWLLVPYLAWVSFASYLNAAIWFLN